MKRKCEDCYWYNMCKNDFSLYNPTQYGACCHFKSDKVPKDILKGQRLDK